MPGLRPVYLALGRWYEAISILYRTRSVTKSSTSCTLLIRLVAGCRWFYITRSPTFCRYEVRGDMHSHTSRTSRVTTYSSVSGNNSDKNVVRTSHSCVAYSSLKASIPYCKHVGPVIMG